MASAKTPIEIPADRKVIRIDIAAGIGPIV